MTDSLLFHGFEFEDNRGYIAMGRRGIRRFRARRTIKLLPAADATSNRTAARVAVGKLASPCPRGVWRVACGVRLMLPSVHEVPV